MKKALPFLIFLFFLQGLSAQTDFRFADSTAQWNELSIQYYSGFLADIWTTIYTPCADTIIHGIYYQKICNDQGEPIHFIREDSLRRVFQRDYPDSLDVEIYDFSKKTGDTFSVARGVEETMTTLHVDSIDSIKVGIARKRMYLSFVNSGLIDVWIEGVGALHYDNLWDGYLFIDGPSYALLCFFENNQLLYHNDSLAADNVCVVSTGINGVIMASPPTVFPNPTIENFTNVQFAEPPPGKTTFQLFDLTGRMVLQQPLTKNLNQVELPDISKGMYLYNIISVDQKIYSGKFVVQ